MGNNIDFQFCVEYEWRIIIVLWIYCFICILESTIEMIVRQKEKKDLHERKIFYHYFEKTNKIHHYLNIYMNIGVYL